ncbi:MAG: AAA family ATPase, partial [Bacteroidetes bacterium]|nr:AAA family ATPase [Bacteroidota bacterium]
SKTQKQQDVLEQLLKEFPDKSLRIFVDSSLTKRLPKFLYFDTYHSLPGKIALTDLKNRVATQDLSFGDKIFLALLEMTSTSLAEVENIGHSEKLIMELEAIENSLTDQIFEYWTQNKHLDVKFRFDRGQPNDPKPFDEGYVFNTRISNRRHKVTVPFDERSTGFIWFFSFLVWFSQVKKNYGSNLFILLDEPGLSLHGKAQKDLLRYINETLRPNHQVIYSAHSPFMIDDQHIFSLRTVEDVVEKIREADKTSERIVGTKVSQKILSRDRDSLLPLQGIVGFDIAQTMFVGPYVVVAEGPSESALFRWFSRTLLRRGKECLDIRWAICPAESASKVSSFVTLFHGRGLKIAALMDYHQDQKKMVDKLEKSGLLEKGHLLKTTTYAVQDEADIEDVVGREMYVDLVNKALLLPGNLKISKTRKQDAEHRVVKEADAHCSLLPVGFPEFDHYLPINYLLQLSGEEIENLPGLDQALVRFEKMFKDLNSLI